MTTKRKIIILIMSMIFLMILLATRSCAYDILEIEYEYDEDSNQVIAKIISSVELKDTKPTWKLSEDKKTYTKVFSSNMSYSTPVVDINGNTLRAEINVSQVKNTEIQMEYIYDETTNQVTANMISNVKLEDTKPTWQLSEDKKTYTKVFSNNMSYTTPVVDINGNVISVEVKITQVQPAKIKMEYIYDEITNQVTAKMISNIELQDTKPTWELSEDKKTYTKVFSSNMTYSTPVVDINGNTISVNIDVTKIDTKGPEITLEYNYNEDDTVTITMKSNEKIADTKPSWKLSEDQLSYQKTFNEDQNYSTAVQDIYGNITDVKIVLKKKKVEYIKPDNQNIIVTYMYTSYNNVVVQVKSNVEFKDTKPSWKLSEDKKTYTKIFYSDIDYSTIFQFVDDSEYDVGISIDYFFKIIYEVGTYGASGAKIRGINGGSDLEYLRFGNGENVLFATFCVHGYEDSWDRDGTVLVNIANNFYNRLVNDQDIDLAKKWTIYIFREVNPDGRRMGYTKDGPGRTTLYSKAEKGIDINRSWQTGSEYKKYTDDRNYNGTSGFQAYEAEYLRDFLLSHKSQNGETVLVDLHGWEDQLIGDEQICQYYKQQYTSCRTTGYGKYGTQYLITWGRQNLGAKVALVELPLATNYAEVENMGLSEKYINATLNMLKGI